MFKPVLTGLNLTNTSYLDKDTSSNTAEVKTLINGTLLSLKISFEKDITIGNQIENYLNEILRFLNREEFMYHIDFEYPMYIVATEEDFEKLVQKFKLKM